MPVSFQTEPDTGVVIAICSGVLQLEEAKRAAAALWETPGWAGTSAVWDFRAAEFDVSTSDVREIAKFILREQPAPPPAKIAFITQREVDFGMARVFQAYREDSRTEFRVFRDSDEGFCWAREEAT